MKKLFYLIVFLSVVFASAQGLEPKTYVGNGIVIGPKTTTEINALTVTPNGYIQVNETTGTFFLRIGGSWVNTGLASNISITDSGNNFTATDVEGALAELASSGSSLSPNNLGSTSKTLTQADFDKFNYSSSNLYLKVDNSVSIGSRAAFQPIAIDSFQVLAPDTGVTFVGNGITSGPVFVDSTGVGGLFKIADNLYSISSAYQKYSIAQATGVSASNITENAFKIDVNDGSASVGTIVNCECSIDGAAPSSFVCADGITITGRTASTAYNVNVRYVDKGGNRGPYSADLSVTTASGGDVVDSMSGLIASWREDDLVAGSTTNWVDRINSYVAVAKGGITASSDGSGGVHFVYDGTNDGHAVDSDPVALDFTPGTDTFSVVFKTSSIADSSEGVYVMKGAGSTHSTNQYGYMWQNSSTAYVYKGGSLAQPPISNMQNSIFVLSYSTTGVTVWRNGTLIDTYVLGGTNTTASVLSFASRGGGTNSFSNISLKDVLIFDTNIGQTEVDSLQNNL